MFEKRKPIFVRLKYEDENSIFECDSCGRRCIERFAKLDENKKPVLEDDYKKKIYGKMSKRIKVYCEGCALLEEKTK